MRGNDRLILIGLPLVALGLAFWFLLISPKRQEAADLQTQIDSTRTELDAARSEISLAEQAREEFPRNYGELVKLGRAVPEDDDQATLVYEMSELGAKNALDFRSFKVVQGAATPAPAAPPDPATTEPSATDVPAETTTTAAAPATEASAATLPLGAVVGPAGLPVTPYEFTYWGGFFDVADFLADVDGTVTTAAGSPEVHGRLMTIDGFALTPDPVVGFPEVEGNFAVTTYMVPAEQGIAGGATPAGPAPVAEGSPTTVSADPSAGATATPTAAATAPAP